MTHSVTQIQYTGSKKGINNRYVEDEDIGPNEPEVDIYVTQQ